MPAIRNLLRALDDSICPPGQPFCATNPQDHAASSQRSNKPSDALGSYAVPIILLTLAGVFFLLWLSWAQWPKDKAKALWKMRKGRKDQDKGIHSPDSMRNNTNSFGLQDEFDEDKYASEEDMDMVDLEIDEKELGPMRVINVVGMK